MVKECFKCGISEEKARLFDGLCEEGIVGVCSKCSLEEDILLIKKPCLEDSEPAEEKKPEKKIFGFEKHPEDVSLKQIVNENFEKKYEKIENPKRKDLVENFHWIIMRARRRKHLTRRQFAEALAEPESAIIMAEKGVLPNDGNKLISKIQSYLGVRLIKPEYDVELKQRVKEKGLNFDPVSLKSLTIADLKELQEEEKKEMLSKENKEVSVETEEGEGKLVVEEDNTEEVEIASDSDEFGIEDMNELIFRKKE